MLTLEKNIKDDWLNTTLLFLKLPQNEKLKKVFQTYNSEAVSHELKKEIMEIINNHMENWSLNFEETMKTISNKYKSYLEIYFLSYECTEIYSSILEKYLRFKSNFGWTGELQLNKKGSIVEFCDGTKAIFKQDKRNIWRIEVITTGSHFHKIVKQENKSIIMCKTYSDSLFLKNFTKKPVLAIKPIRNSNENI